MKSYLKRKWEYLILVIFSIIVSSFSPLNPLIEKGITTDQAVFLTIARGILNGKLAYVDYFDHKGVLLYLLLALGQKLGKELVGNFLIEIIMIFLSCVFLYKIGRLFADKWISLIAVMTLFIVDMKMYTTSNSEEYIFPLLCISVYLMMLGLKTTVKKTYAFWIGFCGILVFFIKYNYCLIWAAIGIFLFLHMLFNGEKWKNVFLMTLSFIGGMLLAASPLVLYLVVTGSFGAFMDSYVLYSMRYAGYTGLQDRINSMLFLMDIPLKFVFLAAMLVIVILGVLYMVSKKWRDKVAGTPVFCKEYIYWVLLSIVIIMATVSPGQSWIYYRQALMIVFLLPIILFGLWLKELLKRQNRKKQIAGQVVYLILLLFILRSSLTASNFCNEKDERYESAKEVVSIIRQECDADDTIISYANDCSMYYYSEVNPASRIFFPGASVVDDAFVDELMKDLERNKPKIATFTLDWKNGMTDHMISVTEQYIEENYEMIYEDEFRQVYLRKGNGEDKV